MELNDGSCFRGCQIVFEEEKLDNYAQISKLNVGAAVEVEGVVVVTPEMKQPFEIKAEKITIAGESTPDYPLQKKRHSRNFCGRLLICGLGRICFPLFFAFGRPFLMPFTAFSRSGGLFMCIRRLLPPATVRAPGRCSASQRWIRMHFRVRKTAA